MDLAKYCVNAVLVEGRSMRAVGAATGRSKSWVQRHVALYQAGGEEALVPLKRGPKVPANLTAARVEDKIVAWRIDAGPGPSPGTWATRRDASGAVHHPPGAGAPRLRHPPAPPSFELGAFRVGSAPCLC